MERGNFIESLVNVVVNEEMVSKIQQIYRSAFPDEVKKVLSFAPHGVFIDGDKFCRLLSCDEILNASDELHVDFIQHGIVPLFDIGDNNFVVFDLSKCYWKKFNIVDEVSYGEKSNLAEII